MISTWTVPEGRRERNGSFDLSLSPRREACPHASETGNRKGRPFK